MSKTEDIALLVSECLERCRASGFTLGTLIQFLDEMRSEHYSEVDVQHVDAVMRHIMKDIIIPEGLEMPAIAETDTSTDGLKETKVVEN